MVEIVGIALLALILSALSSGAEIAFVSANRLRIRIRVGAHRNPRRAQSTLQLLRDSEKFLIVTLVGTNIGNITFGSIAGAFLQPFLHLDELSVVLATSLIVLVFGESIPKSIFREFADRLVMPMQPFIEICYIAFYPIVRVVSFAVRFVLRSFGVQTSAIADVLTKEDIRALVKEQRFATRILEFGDMPIGEIMVPRTRMASLDISTSILEARRLMAEWGFSKVPVYSETPDNIVGVAHARDLFGDPKQLTSVTREILFVPESKRCSELLLEFRKRNQSMAIVVNEFGGTEGLVTAEDILEEVVGEIENESALVSTNLKQLADGAFEVDGNTPIEEIGKVFGVLLVSAEFNTIGGYVIGQLGRVPRSNERTIIAGNISVNIINATPTRILTMRLSRSER